MEYQIVPMSPEHIPQIAELEKLCFSSPWSQASIASELENPLSLWLAAVERGQVLGYVGAQSVLDEADMMNLAVRPAQRKKGIGRRLVLALIEQLKGRGVRALTLEVRAGNSAAIGVYESLGFIEVGRRPRYYTKPAEDALLLKKEWKIG